MACLRHYLHLDLLGVRDALKNLPYQIGRDLTGQEANALAAEYTDVGATVELIFTGDRPNPYYGPLQRDKLWIKNSAQSQPDAALWRELPVVGGDSSDFELGRQACGSCQKIGVLASEWRAGRPCPMCGGLTDDQGTAIG